MALGMDQERLKLMSQDVYFFVFDMLDAEPDVDGDTAAYIATLTQQKFETLAQEEL